jgi:hypothetical protein
MAIGRDARVVAAGMVSALEISESSPLSDVDCPSTATTRW